MPTKYIGRVGVFQGKTLFEIAANLKNLGAGRVVYRDMYAKRYPEKSYYILEKVLPNMGVPNFTEGEAWGYKVFRGAKFPKPVQIEAGFKKDWKLVPKEDEEEFCKIDKVYTRKLYKDKLDTNLPPLMEHIMKEHISRLDHKVELPYKLKYSLEVYKSNLWKRGTCDIDDSFVLQKQTKMAGEES